MIGIFWEGSYIFGLKRQFGVNRHVQPKYLIPIIIDIWSMNYVSFEKRKTTFSNSNCQCIDCDNETYSLLIVIGREEICCVYGRHNNELHF